MTRLQVLWLFYGLAGIAVVYLLVRMARKPKPDGNATDSYRRPEAAREFPPVAERPIARAVPQPLGPRPEHTRPEPVLPLATGSPAPGWGYQVQPPPLPGTAAAAMSSPAAAHAPEITGKIEGGIYRTQASAASVTPALYSGIGKKVELRPSPVDSIDPETFALPGDENFSYGRVTPMLSSLLPDSTERHRQTVKELQEAGYYERNAVTNFRATRYLLIVVPVVLLGLMLLVVPPQFELYILGSMLLIPLLGWALPRLVLKSQAKERMFQIERAMPDMLDMLSMCVSQGMTLPTALSRVTQEMEDVHPALHKELQIVSEQTRIGGLAPALNNFSNRVSIPEVQSFTALLTQTEKMGTSVSAALSDYSDNMRSSLKQRADEKGNQAAFKLLFPTVLCLMPAVYMFLLGPSILELAEFAGRDDSTLREANVLIRQTGSSNNFDPRGR
jgi:tight adherence protein C